MNKEKKQLFKQQQIAELMDRQALLADNQFFRQKRQGFNSIIFETILIKQEQPIFNLIQTEKIMGSSESKLLLIGLDNSGKTTILSRIIDPDRMNTQITPTIGYKKSKFTRNNIQFEVFDMSGQSKYRDLWQQNANHSSNNKIDGIIFVVDGSDKMRINVARSELQLILESKDISTNIPFLFYVNKMDIKGACSIKEVEQIMRLKETKRFYRIFKCSGLSGQGVEEGILWLSSYLKPIVDSR